MIFGHIFTYLGFKFEKIWETNAFWYIYSIYILLLSVGKDSSSKIKSLGALKIFSPPLAIKS